MNNTVGIAVGALFGVWLWRASQVAAEPPEGGPPAEITDPVDPEVARLMRQQQNQPNASMIWRKPPYRALA